MFRKTVVLMVFMVFLVGTVSVLSGQTSTTMDAPAPALARALLDELGSMLREIPETKEDCQALLKRIKDWQAKKLKELDEAPKMLRITAPPDKSQVLERPFVEGRVADPNVRVWVIVHPMEVGDYWVQPSVTIKEDGAWKVKIYIGRPGNIDVGKQFEIMAVANPKVELKEGKVLKGWPEAQWKSQVIEVTRK